MHSKKSNIGMAAKAFLLTAIGLPMGVSAQGVIEEKADTIVVYPHSTLRRLSSCIRGRTKQYHGKRLRTVQGLCGRKIEYCHHSQSKTDVTQYACQSREEH